MSMRNVLFCALIALGPVAMPAAAAVNISVVVAPPAPRYEMVPAPRAGYAWAPGYWQWEGERHVWAPGRWLVARPGSYWVGDRWDQRNGRHNFVPGRWERGSERGEHGSERGERGHEGKGNGKGHNR